MPLFRRRSSRTCLASAVVHIAGAWRHESDGHQDHVCIAPVGLAKAEAQQSLGDFDVG